MTRHAPNFNQQENLTLRSSQNVAVTILAVGDPDIWQQNGRVMPPAGVAFVAYPEVAGVFEYQNAPTVVFSPALARHFDCVELAVLLHAQGFVGAYRALSDKLPGLELIENEIRELCPGLDFKILSIE